MKRRHVLTALGAGGALGALTGCTLATTPSSGKPGAGVEDDGLTRDIALDARRVVHDVRAHRSVWGARGIVAAANHHASRAGMQMLMRGGNAIDAAIAAAAAANVSEPYMSGLGGWGGYMLLYVAAEQKVLALDMMGSSPEAGLPEGLDETIGYRSSIVPGALGGWAEALRRYGTMSLGDVFEPAIDLAESGFVVNPFDALKFSANVPKISRFADSARVFLPGGQAPRAGQLLRQPELAQTFRRIARDGVDTFYRGELATEIVGFLQANGGLLTLRDLDRFQFRWREPIQTTFQGHSLYAMGPGSCAMTLFQALNIMDELDLRSMHPYSAEFAHYWIEACKLAFIDDDRYNTAKDGVQVPVGRLISKDYAREQLRRIDRRGTAAIQGPVMTMAGTTHLSTADRFGNTVSYTTSLGAEFGSGVIVGKTGIAMNNGLDLGFHPDAGHVNSLVGGQIAKGIMSPTIALKDGRPILSVGAAGGYTIPQTIGQVVAKTLAYGMDVQDAIASPRVVLNFRLRNLPANGSGWLGTAWLYFDPTYPADIQQEMASKGFLAPPANAHAGGVQAIYFDQQSGTMAGAADPRRGGSAMAW